MTSKPSLSKRVVNWIARHGKKPMAIPVLSAVSVGDFFVPALPTQTSVMLLAWLQPKRITLIALMFALAAAAGSAILLVIASLLDGFLHSAIPGSDAANYQQWQTLKSYINQYGLYALAIMSLLPTPPRTMVVLSLLSGLSGVLIVTTVFVGKLIWFAAVVTLVSYAPHWLVKLPWIGNKLTRYLNVQRAEINRATITD